MKIEITKGKVARVAATFVNGFTKGFAQAAAPSIAAAGAILFWKRGKKALACVYAATAVSCVARQVVGCEDDLRGDEAYEDFLAEKFGERCEAEDLT